MNRIALFTALLFATLFAGQAEAACAGSAPLCVIASGTSQTATSNYLTYAWNSSTSGAKALSLQSCSASTYAMTIVVKDEKGTAGTDNITITPSGTEKIDGAATLMISTPYQSVTLQCDGNGNWMIE